MLRGITGFGETSRIHTTKILRLSTDLPPVVVEVVDSREKIDQIKPPRLEQIISGGLVTEQEVTVWMYRGGK
ncbi:DUF190 domain-containing protein [Methanogenium cariaci]|uniref:DUF190 domain-containing protein n=1 Tax=Methanogenium cariaci TaxID=2197 RepID=UPI001FE23455|nr:DUF190 domain-containing protein [Methanogenium cariaci]